MDENTSPPLPAPTAEGVLITWLLSAWLAGVSKKRRKVFVADLLDQLDAAAAAPSPDPRMQKAVNEAIPIARAMLDALRTANAP